MFGSRETAMDYVPNPIHILKPNPQLDGNRRWALGGNEIVRKEFS